MPKKRFIVEQIINKQRETEMEMSWGFIVGQVCKKLEVTEQTYYLLRKDYGSLHTDQEKRLKDLE